MAEIESEPKYPELVKYRQEESSKEENIDNTIAGEA